MSTQEQDSARQEPEHSPEEASRWFARWEFYRLIVDAK